MLLSALLGTALAIEPVASTSMGISGWESGLRLENKAGAKHTLYSQPESLLFGDVYAQGQVLLQLTPDFVRGGFQLEFSPLAMLVLRFRYESSWYFGNIKTVYGFENASDAYGDAARDQMENGPGHDQRVTGTAVLRAKVGPAIIATVFDRSWVRQFPGAGVTGDYWFDPEHQLLLHLDDKVLQNTTVALYQKELASERIDDVMIGVMSTYRRAQVSQDLMWRAGPMVVVNMNEGRQNVLVLAQPQFVSRTFSAARPFLALQGTANF